MTSRKSQTNAAGGEHAWGRTFRDFVAAYPKVTLSVVIGVVGVSGLLNAVMFFTALGIPYRLYLGATDFMALAVRSSPSVLGTVIALVVPALTVAAVVWLVGLARHRLLSRRRQPESGDTRTIPAFADYRLIFVFTTIIVLATGGSANYLSGYRVKDRLADARICDELEQPRSKEGEASRAGMIAALAEALFDLFYVDGYLRCASVKLANVASGVDGLVPLGSTTSHSFFYKIDEGFHFTVPTGSIEFVQMSAQPNVLTSSPEKEPAPNTEQLSTRAQATLTALLELHTTIADEVGRISEPTMIVWPKRPSDRADRCVPVEGVEFRFDLASAEFDDEANATALERLKAYFRSADGRLNDTEYLLLIGHTDTLGGVNFNQRLSERRAEAVRDRLAREGLNGVAAQAHAIGLGEGASARRDDPSKTANRRVVVHHCRQDTSDTTDVEVVNRPAPGHADAHQQASLSMSAAVNGAASLR